MWIELHDSSRDHPKIIKLARSCEISEVQALGHMCALWTWVLRMAPDGDLSSFDAEDVEIGARWDGEAGQLVKACISHGLIDLGDYGMEIHDWDDFSGSLKAAQRARDYRKRKRDRNVTIPRQCGDITQNDRTTERPNERPRAFVTTPPPKLPDSKDPKVPPDGEQTFLELRAYADEIHKRNSRGLTNHGNIFWRIMAALELYSIEGCKRIIRGHKKTNDNQKFSGLRFAFPSVSKSDRTHPDPDWLGVYHKAGGKQASQNHAPNMQTPEPSELAAQMEAEAIAEHEKFCQEKGIDTDDTKAIKDFAKKALQGRSRKSKPTKAFE